ncbi:hypothetical protein VCRA2110O173_340005 [Vibrio crassostreae]|nr:hypothetical protein VCRA2110O173_340005 [Vibrio crassostreae]CAK2105203.1 hypothetical protein VCRA2113O207_460015 [Vibrio crassostreae]
MSEQQSIDFEKVDKEALASIIEEINEAVELDFTESKLDYLHNCFINSLSVGAEKEYEKKRYFITKLIKMSELEIEILINFYKAEAGSCYKYQNKDLEDAADFNASLEQLKSSGFLNSSLNGTLSPGIDWGDITAFTLSSFGRDFVKFCLEQRNI